MNAHNPGNGRQTRVRWTDEEREQVANRAAAYLAERPTEKMLDAIRHGINSLPRNRRRDALSVQAFGKEVPLIEAKLKEIQRRPGGLMGGGHGGRGEQEHIGQSSSPGGSSLLGQSAEHMVRYFAEAVADRLSKMTSDESRLITRQDAEEIKGCLGGLIARIDSLEGLFRELATGFGVTLSEGQDKRRDDIGRREQPHATESRPTVIDQASRTTHMSKVKILVVGPNGKQAENIRRALAEENVELDFAQAGKHESLKGSKGNVVIWRKFVNHSDTDCRPDAIVVKDGLRELVKTIKSVVKATAKNN